MQEYEFSLHINDPLLCINNLAERLLERRASSPKRHSAQHIPFHFHQELFIIIVLTPTPIWNETLQRVEC